MRLEQFQDYVEQLVTTVIPKEILEGLNLGVVVSADRRLDDEEQDYYIEGEYIQDISGNQIVLYYGTFKYFYAGDPVEIWQAEILDTLKHELIHHVEARAGQEDLADAEELEVYRRKHK